ncbi:hypothetical protein [Alteromonas gracilis]|uniref:hypothetical protein n=1 Tax=Alteromonas gracilis TaxID=1479524 RepID=UPI0037369F2D
MKMFKVSIFGLLISLSNFEIIRAEPLYGIYTDMINLNDGELLVDDVTLMNDGSFKGVMDASEECLKNFKMKNPLIFVNQIQEVKSSTVKFNFG